MTIRELKELLASADDDSLEVVVEINTLDDELHVAPIVNCESLRAERDSLRAQVADFTEHHASLVEKAMEADSLRDRLAEVERERDAARMEIGARCSLNDTLAFIVRYDTATDIAKWIEGYGAEPVRAKLAASAIREGRWHRNWKHGDSNPIMQEVDSDSFIEARIAEQIAAWLDDICTDAGTNYLRALTEQIRSGAWRKETSK